MKRMITKPSCLSRTTASTQSPLTYSAFFCSTTTPFMRTPSQPAYWCQVHTGTSSISGDCAELDVLQRALDLLVLLLIQLLYVFGQRFSAWELIRRASKGHEGSKSFILNHGSRSRVLTKPLARDIVNFFHFSLDFGHMMDLDLKWSKMVSDWTSFDTT